MRVTVQIPGWSPGAWSTGAAPRGTAACRHSRATTSSGERTAYAAADSERQVRWRTTCRSGAGASAAPQVQASESRLRVHWRSPIVIPVMSVSTALAADHEAMDQAIWSLGAVTVRVPSPAVGDRLYS